MARRLNALAQWVGPGLSLLAAILFAAGLLCWGGPALLRAVPGLPATPLTTSLLTPRAAAAVDATTFLGAVVTSLAVLVAVLIGYNVGALQIVGQTVSLALSRAVLLTSVPAILAWLLTTGVALVYLLAPPPYLAQLWQVLFWFAAAACLSLGYLWQLPRRLSGEYAARWAVADLRAAPIADWEERDGFSVLQAGIAGAAARGDVGTVRAMAQVLGALLPGRLDRSAEGEGDGYVRERYRALKNLLSGCAQHADEGPTAFAYYIGLLTGACLLQAVAIHQPVAYQEGTLYSGVLRVLRRVPDRIDAFWTGVRHGLCRPIVPGAPYLLAYWRAHRDWSAGDPRRADLIAEGLTRLHADCYELAREASGDAPATQQAAEMLADLYRYLGGYLGPEVAKAGRTLGVSRAMDLPRALLEGIHSRLRSQWTDAATDDSATLRRAFERAHAQLTASDASGPALPRPPARE